MLVHLESWMVVAEVGDDTPVWITIRDPCERVELSLACRGLYRCFGGVMFDDLLESTVAFAVRVTDKTGDSVIAFDDQITGCDIDNVCKSVTIKVPDRTAFPIRVAIGRLTKELIPEQGANRLFVNWYGVER